MPIADDVPMKQKLVEEDSVHGYVGESASVAERGGEILLDKEKDTSDLDSGRRLECGRFYTIASPVSDGSPSVHFSRHYFMLDGRVY
jgi:hypothetical protein